MKEPELREAFMVLAGLVIMLSSAIAYLSLEMVSKKQTIAHSCAHYDPQTGGFRWNEEEVGR